MADDYEDEVPDADPGYIDTPAMPRTGPITVSQSQYASPEGVSEARKLFKALESERVSGMADEDEEFSNVKKASEEARRALIEARERLQSRRWNNAKLMLSMASAFGSPTRTGAFGETLGNVAHSMIEPLSDKEKFEADREKSMLSYDQALAGLSHADAADRLALLRARAATRGQLQGRALGVLSRPVQGAAGTGVGSKPLSAYGKQALDEGFSPGTPEFQTRVVDLYKRDQHLKRLQSGTDVDPDAGKWDTLVNSYDAGIPLPPMDPALGRSTKGRQTRLDQLGKEADLELKPLNDGADQARQTKQDIQRFLELNRQVPSNPVIGGPGIGFLTSILSPGAQEMDAISAGMARKQRQPGEGQVSNFDAQQFLKATISRNKDRTANRRLGRALIAAEDNRLAFTSFMNNYRAIHGHLVGARDAWRQYLEDNPIFDPKYPGRYILNKNRIANYADYFRKKRKDPRTDPEANQYMPAQEDDGEEDPDAEPEGHADGGLVEDDDVSDASLSDLVTGNYGPRRNRLAQIARQAAQGATLNFSDELLGAGDPDRLFDERQALQQESEGHPVAAFGSQMAGGVASVAAIEAALKRLQRAQNPKLKAVGALSAALDKVLPKNWLARSSIVGSTTGAVAGLGASDENTDGTLVGAELGAVAGPAGAALGRYGPRAAFWLRDKMRNDGISGADAAVLDAIERDGLQPADLHAQMAADSRLRVPSRFGEAGGKNIQSLSEESAATHGDDPAKLVADAENLQRGANTRVGDQINTALAPSNYMDEAQRLTDALYKNAEPLYATAYKNNPAVKSKMIMKILDTPAGRKAVKDTYRRMQNNPNANFGKPDVTGIIRKPSLEFLDGVKKSLDQMINKAERKGATEDGRNLRNLRNGLRDELDVAAPGYKDARAQYAGDLEVLDALKMGREQFPNMRPDAVKAALGNMSFAEKDALRTGVAEHLFDELSKTPYSANAADKLVGSPAYGERLAYLFDKPRDYNRFMTALRREHELFARRARVIAKGGKPPSAAAADALEDDLANAAGNTLDVAGQAAFLPGVAQNTGGPYAAARIMSYVKGKIPGQTKKSQAVARIMSESDPKNARALVDRLESERTRIHARRSVADRIATRTGVALSTAAQPDPAFYDEDDRNE